MHAEFVVLRAPFGEVEVEMPSGEVLLGVPQPDAGKFVGVGAVDAEVERREPLLAVDDREEVLVTVSDELGVLLLEVLPEALKEVVEANRLLHVGGGDLPEHERADRVAPH